MTSLAEVGAGGVLSTFFRWRRTVLSMNSQSGRYFCTTTSETPLEVCWTISFAGASEFSAASLNLGVDRNI